jgi:RIO-like serine/threonine protein kinase
MASRQTLKRDLLGAITLVDVGGQRHIERNFSAASHGLGWLARIVAHREVTALQRLSGLSGVPTPMRETADCVIRSYIDGEPMHRATPPDRAYFRCARKLLRRVHRAGVAHNDLAKEANWLCLAGQRCAIVDFQLAVTTKRGSWFFRVLAREDLRHLLKHKRQYVPEALTQRELRILANPSLMAQIWRCTAKPTYRFLTRRLLGWPERQGPAEREFSDRT